MSWPLYPREKNDRYPYDRRLSEPRSQSGHVDEEKIFLPLPGIL